jgi:hypothetical protein
MCERWPLATQIGTYKSFYHEVHEGHEDPMLLFFNLKRS